MNVIGNIEYVPPNTIATISCSGISVYETALEGSVLHQRQESALRHYNDLNNSDDNSNNDQMKRIYNHFISHHHSDHSTQSIAKALSHCWSQQRVARHCASSTHSFRFAKNKFK